MKRDRIRNDGSKAGGSSGGRRNGTAGDSPEPVGQRESLLEALRECYGIANGEAEHRIREYEAGNDRAFESDAYPLAALLRGPLR